MLEVKLEWSSAAEGWAIPAQAKEQQDAKARFRRTSGIWMTFPPFVHIVRRRMGIETIKKILTINMQANMPITIWKSRRGYFKGIWSWLAVSEAPSFPSAPPGREVDRRNYICPSPLLCVLTVPLMSPTLQLHLLGVLFHLFPPSIILVWNSLPLGPPSLRSRRRHLSLCVPMKTRA